MFHLVLIVLEVSNKKISITMPFLSKRVVCINELCNAVMSHSMFADAYHLLCDESDVDSSDDEVVDSKIVAAVQYAALSNTQCIFRDTKYHPDVRGRRLGYGLPEWRKTVLGHKYNEKEFIKIFCIPRSLFCAFVQLLKHHVAFHHNGLKQRKHYSIELHLLVLLKYKGSGGNTCTALAVKEGLGIGKGSARNYCLRAVEAVLSLFKDTAFWPGEEEWKEIRNWFCEKYSFPYCVGAVDSTHLGLAFKLELDGEDYWTWKQTYAVSATIVCDDKIKTRYLNVGWPGSVHGQRVFQNSLIQKPQQFTFQTESTSLEILCTPPLHFWFQHIRNLVAKSFYLQGRFSSMTYFCLFVPTLSKPLEYVKVGFHSLEAFMLIVGQRRI
jgi:hypothetical protein